jgi:hypothetical protein
MRLPVLTKKKGKRPWMNAAMAADSSGTANEKDADMCSK